MGWRSNPGGGEIFCSHPDWLCGSPSLLYNGYQAFPRGAVVKVKERVELYL
jgi:hypothetical protein